MPKALTFFRKSGHKFIISAANLKRNGRTVRVREESYCVLNKTKGRNREVNLSSEDDLD